MKRGVISQSGFIGIILIAVIIAVGAVAAAIVFKKSGGSPTQPLDTPGFIHPALLPEAESVSASPKPSPAIASPTLPILSPTPSEEQNRGSPDSQPNSLNEIEDPRQSRDSIPQPSQSGSGGIGTKPTPKPTITPTPTPAPSTFLPPPPPPPPGF